MIALLMTVLLNAEASKAIEIEFPSELELTQQAHPALLRARWVQGPLGHDVDGPMLWPWVSQGRVEKWRRLPGSMSFEGIWYPPAHIEPGTFLVVVSTDARQRLDWTALAVEIETPPGRQLRSMRHDRLGLVCPRGTLAPGETILVQSATDTRVTGTVTWSANAGQVVQEASSRHATVMRYTAPSQREAGVSTELKLTAVSERAGTASCSFSLNGGAGAPASAPTP